MDRYNRIAVSLGALFIILSAIITLLVASGAVNYWFLPGGSDIESESNAWFEPQLRGLAEFQGGGEVAAVVVPIIVIVLMALLLVFQYKGGSGKRERALPISVTDLGRLNVEADSVRLLAERTGSVNRNIVDLRCRLAARRTKPPAVPASIVIACYPQIVMGSDIKELRDDLQTRIKEVVERLTGLQVERVNVSRVRYDRGQERRLME
jgi:hypothetical protein